MQRKNTWSLVRIMFPAQCETNIRNEKELFNASENCFKCTFSIQIHLPIIDCSLAGFSWRVCSVRCVWATWRQPNLF